MPARPIVEPGLRERESTLDTTSIHLVRHGEVSNPDGVVYGRLPGFPLSDRGRQMAVAVAERLGGRDLRLVLASPLERARQTANETASLAGLDVVVDSRLVEAANRFEGSVFGPRQLARHPARLRFLANPIEPAWGEPYTDQVDRMRSVVEDARRQAAGGEAVLVGHQSPIWALRRALAGRPAWGLPGRRQCALASVTTLTYAAGRLTAVRYSEPWRFTQASPPRS